MTTIVLAPNTTEDIKDETKSEVVELSVTDLDFVAGGTITGLLD